MFSTTSKPGSVSPLASSTPTASATPAQPLNKKQQRQAKQAQAAQATPTATQPVAPIATPVATATVANVPTGPTQALTGTGLYGSALRKQTPNCAHKLAVMQAMQALGAVGPSTAVTAAAIVAQAAKVGASLGRKPSWAVRHYVYTSPGMAIALTGIAGAKGYGYCLTQAGLAHLKAGGFAVAAIAPVAAPSVAANSTQATPAAKVA